MSDMHKSKLRESSAEIRKRCAVLQRVQERPAMTKDQVIELAKQAGIRWDTDIDRSEWLVRRYELENLVALVRNAAMEEAAQKCEKLESDYFEVNGDGCASELRNLKEPTP